MNQASKQNPTRKTDLANSEKKKPCLRPGRGQETQGLRHISVFLEKVIDDILLKDQGGKV